MRSKLSVMTARTPCSFGPLAAQSREEPVPYSLPRDHDQRHAVGLIAHRGIEDRHLLAGRLRAGIIDRVAAFAAAHHLVPDADIGEGAAHHHFVIAAARAVGIEIRELHAVLQQIFAGGTVLLDRACRAECDRW